MRGANAARVLMVLCLVSLGGVAHAQAGAEPGKTVTLRGQVTAALRGGTLPIHITGDEQYLVVMLDPVNPQEGARRQRVRSDDRGTFLLRRVTPGSYRFRVRIPGYAPDNDMGEWYQAAVQVKPDSPEQAVEVKIPFLAMKVTEPDGSGFSGDFIRFRVSRSGGKLKQQWGEMGFAIRKGGFAPPGNLIQEGGAITLEITTRGDDVTVGWSWSGKEAGLLLFPLVEEDAPVVYHLTLISPSSGASSQRFSAKRGAAPPELDFRLQPFATVEGKVRLESVEADTESVQLSLIVLDPVDREVLYTAYAPVRPDGAFRFTSVPPGFVLLSARVEGKVGEQESVPCEAHQELQLKAKEERNGITLTLTPKSKLPQSQACGVLGPFEAPKDTHTLRQYVVYCRDPLQLGSGERIFRLHI